MIKYYSNTSSSIDVEAHLSRAESTFMPVLSSYVDIHSYADKIAILANREEAWDGNNMIGLIAYYINSVGRYAFITNVSVEIEYQKQGIARQLLSNAIRTIASKDIETIRLEVHKTNGRAIDFYLRNNFQPLNIDSELDNLKLVLELKKV